MLIELFKSLGINFKSENGIKGIKPLDNTDFNTLKFSPDTDIIESENIEGGVTKNKMTPFVIEGINNVFTILLPLFISNSQYFFWKYPQLELMIRVAALIEKKSHLTLYGLVNIIEIIYSYPNKRNTSKEFWLNLATQGFYNRTKLPQSGHHNIQAVCGRGPFKGVVIAWKVVFPTGVSIQNRQFGFSNSINGSSEESLKLAIKYRDESIQSWVDSIK